MEDISGAEAGRCFALTQQPHEGAETVAGRSPGVNHSLLERAAVMSSCHSGPFFSLRSGLFAPSSCRTCWFFFPLLQHVQSGDLRAKVSDGAESAEAEEEREAHAQRENSRRLAEVRFRLFNL